MLYAAPTGKTHSSQVDHDLCVFIRNNAKTNFSALSELAVADYEPGADCVNCASAIESEVRAGATSDSVSSRAIEDSNGSDEIDEDDEDGDDDWEDEDEYVVDPEKKAAEEAKRGLRDAEQAIYQWEYIAARCTTDTGKAFWTEKVRELREAIEFVPVAEVVEVPEEASEAVADEAKETEANDAPEKTVTRRRSVRKGETAEAAA
ncbi:hypothetical protein EES41_23195 [Streptomyces sp. ADI95-16]|uniref:hypothetical protein n=1 Tax=Streptomyces sp. ADI95-16 TaxID=1522758 RepID=UPI000F3A8EF4|nr:hypothetical protein [Streptomyces sp. ADI95-16]AYV29625.1 hypothetical protein EES41_23195 [Streptomyces sp. ADI95-16]